MLSDPAYVAQQYADASSLNTRIDLHRRFSTNPHGWHRWVFEQFDLHPNARVLESGSGPGTLWLENLDRVPPSWAITVSDLSASMVRQAAASLRGNHVFTFAVADAQAIPFRDCSFDAVVANHMLYHVPDRERAFAEVHRVLRPGGCFYASTVSRQHLHELDALVHRFHPALAPETPPFGLEDGADQLAGWFSKVALRRYDDALVIPEAELLVGYILSGLAGSVLAPAQVHELRAVIEADIAREGAIRITKDSGLFEAIR